MTKVVLQCLGGFSHRIGELEKENQFLKQLSPSQGTPITGDDREEVVLPDEGVVTEGLSQHETDEHQVPGPADN